MVFSLEFCDIFENAEHLRAIFSVAALIAIGSSIFHVFFIVESKLLMFLEPFYFENQLQKTFSSVFGGYYYLSCKRNVSWFLSVLSFLYCINNCVDIKNQMNDCQVFQIFLFIYEYLLQKHFNSRNSPLQTSILVTMCTIISTYE